MIYLDNAATTRLSPTVLDAMLPYFKDEYGNAGSIHTKGRLAAMAVKKARQQVADAIGAKPEQIIFTSGGTEANNLAIFGSRKYLVENDKTHIITSKTEHDSVLHAVEALCEDSKDYINGKFYPFYVEPDEYGCVSEKAVSDILTDNTGFVSVMYVNNELGTVNPIKEIGKLCKENNILFHTDCVQTLGSYKIDVKDIPCDYLSISSHKIHGAKGVGALYVRDKKYLNPLIYGGKFQEYGLRGGTENVAGIVGFGQACEEAVSKLEINSRVVSGYKRLFCRVLKEKLSEYNLGDIIHINGKASDGKSPESEGKILSITFDGIDAETLVLTLDFKGICISTGSACQSNEMKPSHVLTAIGMSDEQARSTVRVSFSETNKPDKVEKAAKTMADCVKKLKEIND